MHMKVDVAMMLVSLTLGVGVASVVALQNDETEPVAKLAASRAAVEETVGKDKKQRGFDPGKKLEINDKSESEIDWPEPTSEEVGSADAPRYYQSSPDTNSRQTLKESKRRLDKKKAEYEKSREERRARAEELRQSEARLKVSIAKLVSSPQQMEEHIQQLEDAEEAGEFTQPPASGGSGSRTTVEQELEIAEEDIVARPVEPIPFKRYVQIYKAAAKRYGFAEDWYVLAAVGKVESNHGQNMGPSSAGAMGPMQFLPSTWEQYGVDGNGDGEENIMDPKDAIPAAASYLEDGGAPKDWPKALYAYNHSGQYVREVLGIAESYKRQAEEAEGDEVQPDD
jgi:membrane-bound lytic murein transglycosylase B